MVNTDDITRRQVLVGAAGLTGLGGAYWWTNRPCGPGDERIADLEEEMQVHLRGTVTDVSYSQREFTLKDSSGSVSASANQYALPEGTKAKEKWVRQEFEGLCVEVRGTTSVSYDAEDGSVGSSRIIVHS